MTEQHLIRVMIVDDHAVVRSGLAAFITAYTDLELIGEAENGDEALVRCQSFNPDVILMDLKMPGKDGITATRQIKEKYPDMKVIALTSFQEDELVQNALEAGAIGYLMKNVTARDLAAAIRSAYAGKITLSPEAAQILVDTRLHKHQYEDLTQRELQVLKLMVKGLNNTEIASDLVISTSTVKYHISNILGKLGVENRVAAVTTAIQNKLI